MNKRKEKKRKNPPLPQQKPRERKRKKTQLTGPGKVIKGLKSSMWRCRHAFLRYGGLRKYSTCSMRKGRKIFTITSPPPPLSALNQQALYQWAVKVAGRPYLNKILRSETMSEQSTWAWHWCMLTNTRPFLWVQPQRWELPEGKSQDAQSEGCLDPPFKCTGLDKAHKV